MNKNNGAISAPLDRLVMPFFKEVFMFTNSGPMCDVCGHYILPLDPDEQVNLFGVKGIEQELCCHNKCKEMLLACGKDWEKLPLGPLRKLFEEATASLSSVA